MPLTLHILKRWAQLACALAPVMFGGCGAFEPSDIPTGAIPMEPPAHFSEWWVRTEQCSGLTGSLSAVHWYVMPDVSSFQTDIGEKVGLWVKTGSHVAIILAETYADHELVVRHEMLHQLLQRAGHPQEYFDTKCGLTWERWGAGPTMIVTATD